MASSKKAAEEFVKRWTGKGNEEQDKHLYWIGLFQDVLGLTDALDRLKFEQPVHTKASDHQGFIDVLIPTASVIVEQKGIGHDLSKAEVRQGRKVTPAQQALAYTEGLPLSQKPRYVIASNFAEMWVYDTERDPLCKGDPLIIKLEDLPKNLPAIQFLAGKGQAPETIQRAVSVEAGRIMGRIHEAVAKSFESAGFDRNDEATHHAISAFCCRVMFLMFCEDEAGLIPQNAFRNYVQHFPADYLRNALRELFEWLDTPDDARDPFASDLLKAFPYMNGGLFSERTVIPTLSEDLRTTIIVEGCQEFDWSEVNPTVFGSIFEGSLSHDQRRAGGMHYTSPENIHKVIDPLFLDDLEAAFAEACAKPLAGGARTKALEDLHERLGSISIFDPACGSGNFLTESYQCLRRLENRVLIELSKDGQISFDIEGTGDDQVKVTLANFHGIEINDFACAVARTALWIAEKQADADTASIVHRVYQALPLTDYGNIHQGNALRMDWNEVVPADRCSFICGNPPFIGARFQTPAQKADVLEVFDGAKNAGNVDYVACWYKKGADYMRGHPIRAALVSTNSICQGEQVANVWKPLTDLGIHIDFAHRTFIWDSQADDAAHVHVVIVGFSREDVPPKRLYVDNVAHEVTHINGYLVDAPDAFVWNRSRPICDVPAIGIGSQPIDGGNYLFTDEEKKDFVCNEPGSERFFHRWLGSNEFINGKPRWVLWLGEATPADLKALPNCMQRVRNVREFRLSSKRKQTLKAADTPQHFGTEMIAGSTSILIPKVSSERRRYIPLGFIEPDTFCSDLVFLIPDATLYHFGVLHSQFHNAWMRTVCGRLKSDYRYSGGVVYNNYVWPDSTPDQEERITTCAEAVLNARTLYQGSTLADMYDPDNDFLFPKLMSAHKDLDAAVEAAYGVGFNGDEEKIVAHLFKLYAEKTKEV